MASRTDRVTINGTHVFEPIDTGNHRGMVAAITVENLGPNPLTGFAIEVAGATKSLWFLVANQSSEFTSLVPNSKIEANHGKPSNDPTTLQPGQAIFLGVDLKIYPRLRVSATTAAENPTTIEIEYTWGSA